MLTLSLLPSRSPSPSSLLSDSLAYPACRLALLLLLPLLRLLMLLALRALPLALAPTPLVALSTT